MLFTNESNYDWSNIDEYIIKKEYLMALSEINRILPSFTKPIDKFFAYYKISYCYIYKKDLKSAIEPLQNAYNFKFLINDKNLIYDNTLQLAIVYIKEQTIIKALPLLEEIINELDNLQFSISLIEANKERRVKNKAFYWLGKSYWLGGDLPKALHYFQRNLMLSKVLVNSDDILQALISLGEVYRAQGQLTKALQFFQESFRFINKNQDNYIESDLNMFIGHVYRDKGKFKQALEKYNLAFSSFKPKKTENSEKIAELIFNILRINHRLGYQEESESYLMKEFPLNSISKPKIVAYKHFIDYLTAFKRKHWSKAQETIENAQNILGLDFNYQIFCYESLAEIGLSQWMENKKDSSSLAFVYSKLDSIKKISMKNNLVASLSKAIFIQAKLSSGLKKYNEAETLFQESLSIANRYDLEAIKKKAHLELRSLKHKKDSQESESQIIDSEIKEIQKLFHIFGED